MIFSRIRKRKHFEGVNMLTKDKKLLDKCYNHLSWDFIERLSERESSTGPHKNHRKYWLGKIIEGKYTRKKKECELSYKTSTICWRLYMERLVQAVLVGQLTFWCIDTETQNTVNMLLICMVKLVWYQGCRTVKNSVIQE